MLLMIQMIFDMGGEGILRRKLVVHRRIHLNVRQKPMLLSGKIKWVQKFQNK